MEISGKYFHEKEAIDYYIQYKLRVYAYNVNVYIRGLS